MSDEFSLTSAEARPTSAPKVFATANTRPPLRKQRRCCQHRASANSLVALCAQALDLPILLPRNLEMQQGASVLEQETMG